MIRNKKTKAKLYQMQTNAKIQYIIIMPENDNETTGVK